MGGGVGAGGRRQPLSVMGALVIVALMLASLVYAQRGVIEPLIEAIAGGTGGTSGAGGAGADSDVDMVQLSAVTAGLWAIEVMVLLGRHFPHRQVLKRLTLSLLLAATIGELKLKGAGGLPGVGLVVCVTSTTNHENKCEVCPTCSPASLAHLTDPATAIHHPQSSR